MALVLASSQQTAQRAAALAVVEVDAPETPPLLTAQQAMEAGSVYNLGVMFPMSGFVPGSMPGGSAVGSGGCMCKACIMCVDLWQCMNVPD